MGKILYEIDKIVDDEEKMSDEKITAKVNDDGDENDIDAGVDDIVKHIEAVEAAVNYIDGLTPGKNSEAAFDAEISLRKALAKMQELSDEVYKNIAGEKEKEI